MTTVDRPLLTDAARPSTFDVAAVDEHGVARDVAVAGEHPLTLYVDKHELLTLMTLGAAPEALAIVAEILGVLRGAGGGSLRDHRGPIHPPM